MLIHFLVIILIIAAFGFLCELVVRNISMPSGVATVIRGFTIVLCLLFALHGLGINI